MFIRCEKVGKSILISKLNVRFCIYYYMKREQPLKLLDLRLSHSSLINLTNGWDLDSENIP